MEEKLVCSTNNAGMNNWISMWGEGVIMLDFYLLLHTKIYLKWIIDFNAKAKIINFFFEENIGENLCNLVLGKYFSDRT